MLYVGGISKLNHNRERKQHSPEEKLNRQTTANCEKNISIRTVNIRKMLDTSELSFLCDNRENGAPSAMKNEKNPSHS